MRHHIIIAVLILGVIFYSCTNQYDPEDMRFGTPFSLTLKVQDSLGNPIKGLRISAYNQAIDSVIYTPGYLYDTSTATIIDFDVSCSSVVDISVYDLNGSFLRQMTHEAMSPGYYSCLLQRKDFQAGTRALKAVCTAVSDSSKSEVFRDSVYLIMWRQDPAKSVLGYTSADGTFGTVDSLAFPNTLTLPELLRTTWTGPEPIYVFTIPNEVVFALYDSRLNKGMQVIKKVGRGKNAFTIQWKPQELSKAAIDSRRTTPGIVRKDVIPPPKNFRLHQNYPNPFN